MEPPQLITPHPPPPPTPSGHKQNGAGWTDATPSAGVLLCGDYAYGDDAPVWTELSDWDAAQVGAHARWRVKMLAPFSSCFGSKIQMAQLQFFA